MKKTLALILVGATIFGVVTLAVKYNRDKQETKRFEQEFTDNEAGDVTNLLGLLPKETEDYTVSYQPNSNSLLIVPKIPFTSKEAPQDQLRRNWTQYELGAKGATDWLKSQGVSYFDFPIEWWLQDWWPDGKRLTF